MPPATPAMTAPPQHGQTPPATPPRRAWLGLDRRRRMRIYLAGAGLLAIAFVIWSWSYLRPTRWVKYTDQIAFEQVARDVELGHVMWAPAEPETAGFEAGAAPRDPAVSADGTRMVHAAASDDGNLDLFLRRWDGNAWGPPQPLRALNSAFDESGPALSHDGAFLFFASDRPGGRGGSDIWVAKWDGLEYAWPLPLTSRVNTPFDEVDPALPADGSRLYFSSNRPFVSEAEVIRAQADNQVLAKVDDRKGGFDLYAADLASEVPFDLIVERQLSMLYSLREGALADRGVMAKLGGSQRTEAAVDRGLAFLAATQENDGRWDIRRHGGQGGHDEACTAFALLAFYGRGERHDQDCRYREVVRRGLDWLLNRQDPVSGDLRGPTPQHNSMYDHGIASLALVEAYGVTKDQELRPRVIAAIEFMTDSQHEEGGWRYRPGERGDLSVAGGFIMAMVSARMSGIPVPDATFDGARRFLERLSGGEHGGSYGYTDPPGRRNSGRDGMNAAGFFCSQILGASPHTPRAHESAAILDRVRERVFRERDLYLIYYATLAAYQHQGPLWRGWRDTIQQAFIDSQRDDGAWQGGGGHSSNMGRVIQTAITLLCLQAHYRYTPLYGLGHEPDPAAGPRAEVISFDALPATPEFRHAKRLAVLNSPADETGPFVTPHGDFLYFASNRAGGFGGYDIYRSRISGKGPTPPENVGPEVNSTADESGPALRMEGFHLLFTSNRDGDSERLFTSASRRLVREFDYGRLPGPGWWFANLPWLGLLALGAAGCWWAVRRALAAARGKDAPPSTPKESAS